MPRSPAGERGPGGECPVALVAMHVGLLLASGAATSRRAPVGADGTAGVWLVGLATSNGWTCQMSFQLD